MQTNCVEKIAAGAVHKPNSVPANRVAPVWGDDHSSVDAGCPAPPATYPGASGGPPSNAPLFGLAPGGVYLASPVARGTGALLPHRFTLTRHNKQGQSCFPYRAVCSLLHFPSCCHDSTLWSTLPCGVRTFLRQRMRFPHP